MLIVNMEPFAYIVQDNVSSAMLNFQSTCWYVWLEDVKQLTKKVLGLALEHPLESIYVYGIPCFHQERTYL